MWGDIAIAFLIAFIAAFVVTPYTIKLARKVGAVDIPKEERKRRVNKHVMPRLGGLAVIAGFVFSTIYLVIIMSVEGTIDFFGPESYYIKLIGFLVGAFVLGITCFVDDIKSIHPMIKLSGQIIAAAIVVASGIRIDNFAISFLSFTDINEVFSIILTIGWIVGITNAINLIDGLDGLSTGISLISCVSLLIIFSLNDSPLIAVILITALAGSLTGFLPFNFNPAKTFIGDTGSNFLGYSLAVISILGVAKTYTAIVIVAPLIVLALPVFDTIWAIIRRIVTGKSLKAIVMPDRGHLHHKLIARGYNQKQAVFILYGISAACRNICSNSFR